MSRGPPTTLEWKFSQVFGERSPGEDAQDVEFDKSGEYLATGDRGGRVVIFERKDVDDFLARKELEHLDFGPKVRPEYRHKTEFQSHEPEFDYLKSVEIEEKVNKIRWCMTLNDSLFLLSANDKTIKLWKLKERKVKKVKDMDLNPFVCSENALLAEKSFLHGQQLPSFTNGNLLERASEVPNYTYPLAQGGATKISSTGEGALARCRRVYAHAHDYNINSISNNSDYETFVSADDLRINLWNVEVGNRCFNIVDMKPANMEDLVGNLSFISKMEASGLLIFVQQFGYFNDFFGQWFLSYHHIAPENWVDCNTSKRKTKKGCQSKEYLKGFEVITSAEFHPVHCNLLAYSSSRGFIRLVDMRQSALCDQHARIFQDHEPHGSKSFLSEIIKSISDIKFASDGRHILTRDYMNLKLWDLHMEASPVATFKIHEYLRPKLSELYNNDSIFDKFECCLSGDGLHFATGTYSNLFRVFSHCDGNEEGTTVEASKNPNRKQHHQGTSRGRRRSLSNLTLGHFRHGEDYSSSESNGIPCDLTSKLLHLAWHPSASLIACAIANSLYMYYA